MDNYDAMVIGGGVVGLVVLGGGGRHRIHEGGRLALAGVAPWLVVTDPWHTRRARMIFRRVLHGAGVAVCAHPAPKPGHATAAWWTTADGVRDTWTEYQKLALYLLGHR